QGRGIQGEAQLLVELGNLREVDRFGIHAGSIDSALSNCKQIFPLTLLQGDSLTIVKVPVTCAGHLRMTMNQMNHYHSGAYPVPDQRGIEPVLFLVELDPQRVVDGVRYDDNYLADDV